MKVLGVNMHVLGVYIYACTTAQPPAYRVLGIFACTRVCVNWELLAKDKVMKGESAALMDVRRCRVWRLQGRTRREVSILFL